jgi:hypothetical protein
MRPAERPRCNIFKVFSGGFGISWAFDGVRLWQQYLVAGCGMCASSGAWRRQIDHKTLFFNVVWNQIWPRISMADHFFP